MTNKESEYKILKEFWPYYLSEHKNSLNKILHFVGTACSLYWIIMSIVKKKPSNILLALFNGYGFAWIGHFLVEKNRPATFKYPIKSFVSDFLMFGAIIIGKVKIKE